MNLSETKEKAKDFAKNFALLLIESELYPPQHPTVLFQLRQTFSLADKLLSGVDCVFFDIIEGQFVFEGIPLYEIKHTVEKIMDVFSAKHIRNIRFLRGLTPQELTAFAAVLKDNSIPAEMENLQNTLREKNITHIGIKNVTESDSPDKAETIQPQKIYGAGIEAGKLMCLAVQEGKALPATVIDKVAQDITNMVLKQNLAGLAMTSLRGYDEYTFTHSANVAILSVSLAANVVTDAKILNNLASAAMLHDIGKTLIPAQILNKPEKLTDEEWKIMRGHPLLGARILEEQQNTDKLAILIAVQHHMKYDLSGYPRIDGITELHPLSLIVNIIDTYDALTSKRIYKKPLPPDKALAIMMRFIGCDFEPALFKIFTQMMGVYPPGCFVRLTSREIAVSQKVNPLALLLPEVKIITDSAGNLLGSPRLLDLSDEEQNTGRSGIEELLDPVEIGLDPLKFI